MSDIFAAVIGVCLAACLVRLAAELLNVVMSAACVLIVFVLCAIVIRVSSVFIRIAVAACSRAVVKLYLSLWGGDLWSGEYYLLEMTPVGNDNNPHHPVDREDNGSELEPRRSDPRRAVPPDRDDDDLNRMFTRVRNNNIDIENDTDIDMDITMESPPTYEDFEEGPLLFSENLARVKHTDSEGHTWAVSLFAQQREGYVTLESYPGARVFSLPARRVRTLNDFARLHIEQRARETQTSVTYDPRRPMWTECKVERVSNLGTWINAEEYFPV